MLQQRRLDDKGVLLVPPGNGAKDALWFGESSGSSTVEIEPGMQAAVHLFDSVTIGEEIVNVDDSIYLTPDAMGEPCEMSDLRTRQLLAGLLVLRT